MGACYAKAGMGRREKQSPSQEGLGIQAKEVAGRSVTLLVDVHHGATGGSAISLNLASHSSAVGVEQATDLP